MNNELYDIKKTTDSLKSMCIKEETKIKLNNKTIREAVKIVCGKKKADI